MHRALLLGLSLLATAQVATADPTSTTTTAPGGTTTTTLAAACDPADVTLAGLACRTDLFLASVSNAAIVARLRDSAVKRVQKAVRNLDDAEAFCARGDSKRAGKAVGQAGSHIAKALRGINSNNGRKNIPDAVRAALNAEGRTLRTDLQAARKQVGCTPAP